MSVPNTPQTLGQCHFILAQELQRLHKQFPDIPVAKLASEFATKTKNARFSVERQNLKAMYTAFHIQDLSKHDETHSLPAERLAAANLSKEFRKIFSKMIAAEDAVKFHNLPPRH